ncbi:hypothetical protein LSH36_3g32053 [Paralvinella palmiformis]|uniref:Guanylate cyclase domain-containing protein n=1 Tax=Paralvinella palmiformis TaxID=53620 RepID=A0AAD9KGP2_9ANNE|nr:hypothetical protein LSH36_3g32053 [Paralvinella palmiformis]
MGLFTCKESYEEDSIFSIDPLTTRGRLFLFFGLSAIPLIPCLGVILYGSVSMSYAIRDHSASANVRNAFVFGLDTAKIISALHVEMAASSAYLASNGSEIIDSWEKIYKKTDDKLSKFEHWANFKIATKERFMSHIGEERQTVVKLNTTIVAALEFYTKHADAFFDWLTRIIDVNMPAGADLNFANFYYVVECLGHLSVLRSLAVVALLRGSLTPKERVYFVTSFDLHMDTIDTRLSETIDSEILMELNATAVDLYEMVTRDRMPNSDQLYQSLVWYRRISTNYDHLIQIGYDNYLTIVNAVTVDVDLNLTAAIIYGLIVFVFLFVISSILIVSAKNSVVSIHGFARVMAMKLLEIKRERHRTEAVLNEMLPRIMTYKLRKGESTPAEQYSSTTIFFSDIEDFSDISAKSAPIDIVVFLNDMYNHMDELMDKGYDTYKVETIGCVYMVVSGIPGRNGIRHASEIARMSLDLMKSTETFVIPHLPDNPLQLRAGIHSGPVVAGVVGNKMPRYCLFGDAVNTASRMQSNGQARRIQISHATKELLDTIGGFTTTERGLINVKVKQKLVLCCSVPNLPDRHSILRCTDTIFFHRAKA